MGKKRIADSKYIVLLLIIGAVFLFLKYVSPLITPMIIAGMFLTVCYPAFDDIQKKTRIKKQYLASAILFLLCAVLIILLWFGGTTLIRKIPDWISGFDETRRNFEILLENFSTKIGTFLHIDTTGFMDDLLEQITVFSEKLEEQVMPNLLGKSWIFIRQLLSVIGVLAVTMIATILLAKDYDSILSYIGANKGSRMVLLILLKVIRYIGTFLKAQLVIMLTIATTCSIVLVVSGVDKGLLYGILAGILDALPFIGTGIVLVPLAIFQLLQGYYIKALFCLIAYGLGIIIREVLEPKLIGKKMGIYPFAVLLSVYAGIKLFGLWGIVKGPIGLVMIQQAYMVYCCLVDDDKQMNYDKETEKETVREDSK